MNNNLYFLGQNNAKMMYFYRMKEAFHIQIFLKLAHTHPNISHMFNVLLKLLSYNFVKKLKFKKKIKCVLYLRYGTLKT